MQERPDTGHLNMTQTEEGMQENCQEKQQKRNSEYVLPTSCENA